jgi:hypothetical protein
MGGMVQVFGGVDGRVGDHNLEFRDAFGCASLGMVHFRHQVRVVRHFVNRAFPATAKRLVQIENFTCTLGSHSHGVSPFLPISTRVRSSSVRARTRSERKKASSCAALASGESTNRNRGWKKGG